MIGDLGAQDATELAQWVAKGDVTPEELLDAALAAVEARNPRIHAVVNLRADVARRMIAQGLPHGPFRGVPFLLKDLGGEAKDFPSDIGSRLFKGTIYPQDATLYTRMAATGLVPFGRTTCPEFGIGTASEARVYGAPTRNPWSLEHTPGGSSGGAAAAVAAGIVAFAHGSDGGGSIRIPAACCGLFGFKATRARLPDGPYAGEAWAGMAIEGFLTRSTRDSAALLDACEGPDLGAPYWAPPLVRSYADAVARPPARLRVALCDSRFDGGAIDAEVAKAVRAAASLLEEMGHEIVPARPEARFGAMFSAWTDIIAIGTALSIRTVLGTRHPREDEVEPVARSAYDYAQSLHPTRYLEAIEEVHHFGREMAAFFAPEKGERGFDILLSATLAEPPAKIGRFNHDHADYLAYRNGPEGIFAHSPFCAAFNASGQPAASVPFGFSRAGLPIGVHLAAGFGQDTLLMALCAEIERARPWAQLRAPLAGPARG